MNEDLKKEILEILVDAKERIASEINVGGAHDSIAEILVNRINDMIQKIQLIIQHERG